MMGGGSQIYTTVIVAAVIVAILWMRNQRPRKLRVELLWIRPVLFAVIAGATLSASSLPTDRLSIAVLFLALVLGIGVGWQRGRFMQILVDPESHAMTTKASPAGLMFIVAILGFRTVFRGVTMSFGSGSGLSPTAIADALILFLGAMIVAQSLEMWLRARKLLAEAQAAKAERASGGLQPPIVT